jgi:hypothetical protein
MKARTSLCVGLRLLSQNTPGQVMTAPGFESPRFSTYLAHEDGKDANDAHSRL